MSDDDAPNTFLERLRALRTRALKSIAGLVIIAIALLPFAERVFAFISEPLIAQLPVDWTMIAKDVASPFMVPLKATLWAAVFLSMPVLLYQAWRSVELWVPREGRRIALPLLVASIGLFYAGVAFAHLLVMPLVFNFFVEMTPANVEMQTDIAAYLGFAIGMLFAFGLAFQMPIAIVIMVWTGLVRRSTLARSRGYVLLTAFVTAMFLTPPDVFSQTLLALPMYVLFEIALLVCARFLPEEPAAEDEAAS